MIWCSPLRWYGRYAAGSAVAVKGRGATGGAGGAHAESARIARSALDLMGWRGWSENAGAKSTGSGGGLQAYHTVRRQMDLGKCSGMRQRRAFRYRRSAAVPNGDRLLHPLEPDALNLCGIPGGASLKLDLREPGSGPRAHLLARRVALWG